MNNSDDRQIASRLLSLEQKVNLLLVAAAIQIVTILIGWVNYLFGSFFWFIVLLAAIGGVLYFFRNQLPQLSGKLIRYVFSNPRNRSESEREMK